MGKKYRPIQGAVGTSFSDQGMFVTYNSRPLSGKNDMKKIVELVRSSAAGFDRAGIKPLHDAQVIELAVAIRGGSTAFPEVWRLVRAIHRIESEAEFEGNLLEKYLASAKIESVTDWSFVAEHNSGTEKAGDAAALKKALDVQKGDGHKTKIRFSKVTGVAVVETEEKVITGIEVKAYPNFDALVRNA